MGQMPSSICRLHNTGEVEKPSRETDGKTGEILSSACRLKRWFYEAETMVPSSILPHLPQGWKTGDKLLNIKPFLSIRTYAYGMTQLCVCVS